MRDGHRARRAKPGDGGVFGEGGAGRGPGGRARPLRLLFVGLLCAVIIAGAGAAGYVIYGYIPNFKQLPPYDVDDNIKRGGINIVFNDALVAEPFAPLVRDGSVYLPADFIKRYLDPYIFWDDKGQWLIITTVDDVLRFPAGSRTYYDNNKPMNLDNPVYSQGGQGFLPQDLAERLYPVTMRLDDTYGMLIIDSADRARQTASVLKKGRARYAPDIKSPVAERLAPGDTVMVIKRDEDFTYVRLNDGLFGYVNSSLLTPTEVTAPSAQPRSLMSPPLPRDKAVNMLWDQVFLSKDNRAAWRAELPPGVNVISPTWFLFDHDLMDGSIISIADKDYISNAHKKNCAVWPLIADETSDVAHLLLSDTPTRQKIIGELLDFISAYGLDGINIDFEKVQPADAQYFLEFLRELRPLMRPLNAALSVDLYVPLFTKYYGRADIANTVDYACVMAYDEHTLADGAGPVGSVGFVDKGVSDTLDEMPRQKVILGIPFYERLWREEPGADPELKISNYSMAAAAKILKNNGARLTWDADTGYNVARFAADEDGAKVNYSIWFEDKDSIALKIAIAGKYKLAGTAAWKFGLETDDIWDVVNSFKLVN